MADKSPHKPNGKKAGKTLKERRAAKKLKRSTSGTIFDSTKRHRT